MTDQELLQQAITKLSKEELMAIYLLSSLNDNKIKYEFDRTTQEVIITLTIK